MVRNLIWLLCLIVLVICKQTVSQSDDGEHLIHNGNDTTVTESEAPTTPKPTEAPTTHKPTEAPTPPPLQTGNWTVTNDTGSVCIHAKMAVQFVINDKVVNLSPLAKENKQSSCSPPDNSTQILALEQGDYIFKLTFAQDKSSVYVRNISLTVNDVPYENSEEHFKVGNGKSYLCTAKATVKMDNVNVTINFSDVHLQAFMKNDDGSFTEAEDCDADSNNLVPIVVACALVLMIVIILIGYLITRRQSRQRGYQSV